MLLRAPSLALAALAALPLASAGRNGAALTPPMGFANGERPGGRRRHARSRAVAMPNARAHRRPQCQTRVLACHLDANARFCVRSRCRSRARSRRRTRSRSFPCSCSLSRLRARACVLALACSRLRARGRAPRTLTNPAPRARAAAHRQGTCSAATTMTPSSARSRTPSSRRACATQATSTWLVCPKPTQTRPQCLKRLLTPPNAS